MVLHGVLRFCLQQQITITSTAADPANTGRHTMSATRYTATVKAKKHSDRKYFDAEHL